MEAFLFLLAFLVLAVISVPLLGGSLRALAELKILKGWLLVAALGAQVLIISVFPHRFGTLHPFVHVSSYLMIAAFLWVNRATPGMWLIGVGGMSNLTAIVLNGGSMPARPEALAAAGIEQHAGEFANSTSVADAKVAFLGDVFAIPESWPIVNNVFSVGDVVICIGVAVLLHRVCGTRLARRPRPEQALAA